MRPCVPVAASSKSDGLSPGLCDLASRRDEQLPTLFMDLAVVATAEQYQVVHHVLPAIRPMVEVMRVCPGSRPIAAGEPAAPVPDDKRLAL